MVVIRGGALAQYHMYNGAWSPSPHSMELWGGAKSIVSSDGAVMQFLATVLRHYDPEGRCTMCVLRSDGNVSDEHSAELLKVIGSPGLLGVVAQREPKSNMVFLPQDDFIFDHGLLASCPWDLPAWSARIPKVFWRGGNSGSAATSTETLRARVVAALIDNTDADVRLTRRWPNADIPERHFGDDVPHETFLQYQAVLLLDGNTIASAQTWTFATGAVPIVVTSETWWFSTLLVPYVHYVPVKWDLSNLREQITWALQSPEAEGVAANARQFAEAYFTPLAQRRHLEAAVVQSLMAST